MRCSSFKQPPPRRPSLTPSGCYLASRAARLGRPPTLRTPSGSTSAPSFSASALPRSPAASSTGAGLGGSFPTRSGPGSRTRMTPRAALRPSPLLTSGWCARRAATPTSVSCTRARQSCRSARAGSWSRTRRCLRRCAPRCISSYRRAVTSSSSFAHPSLRKTSARAMGRPPSSTPASTRSTTGTSTS